MRPSGRVTIINLGMGRRIRTPGPSQPIQVNPIECVDDFPVLHELKDPLRGYEVSLVRGGEILYGSMPSASRKWAVINGKTGEIIIENNRYISCSSIQEGKKTKYVFSGLERKVDHDLPLIFILTDPDIDKKLVRAYGRDYVFRPGDCENLRRAVESLFEKNPYKVERFHKAGARPMSFVSRYKASIKNRVGNLDLFFDNGKCLEVFGRRNNTVILTEADVVSNKQT